MDYKKLEKILLYILLVIAAVVYLYTVAPTLSFWDCGEFIASAHTLAVPHPPGTPFYVFLGKVWLFVVGLFAAILPISKEVAWHMNLLGIAFSLGTVVLVYRMLLKIFRLWKNGADPLTQLVVAFAATLAITFFYTVWGNAVETEVYAASTFIFLLINYLVLCWYESMRNGAPKNHYLLLVFYLIFLSTGIHLVSFLIFIPVYVFVLIVEWRLRRDWLFILLGVFQVVLFPFLFLLPEQYNTLLLIVLGLVLLAGIVLPLNDPRRFRNWRFFWAGVLLVFIGVSTELYLPIRSARLLQLYRDPQAQAQYLAGKNIAPRINECAPGENFNAFYNVLHRSQYGPQYLVPRKTQEQTGFGVLEGYFWQVALFVRYLSWQVAPEGMNRFVRGLLLTVFYAAALWGMVELFRREKKLFLLLAMILFMLVFAMIGYLNLRFSPSDPNPKHQPQEVRERDYFFHTTDVYVGLLMGMGLYGILESVRREAGKRRYLHLASLAAVVLFSAAPLSGNFRLNNRFGNFIPKDYGYNMLISCDDGAVIFTNGDNDTFPLWFAQEVLGIKRKVIVANLSLINTPWYIKQLKRWGAPITLSDNQIKLITDQGYFVTPDRRVMLPKDIMIRHIIAVNAGIELDNKDYMIPPHDFAQKYVRDYRGKRPIYFSSTVSPENFEGLDPYLRIEGIVYRLVGDSIPFTQHVDVERSRKMLYEIYRYTGLFDTENYGFLAAVLPGFEERRKEGEFYDFNLERDINTEGMYSNYAAVASFLGFKLRDQNDIRGTLDAWRFAMLFGTRNPDTWKLRYNLGILYVNLGQIDSAERYFDEIKTNDPRLVAQIGMLYNMVGIHEKAAEYFQKSISMDPRNPHSHMGLLATYLEMNDTVKAIVVLQNWIQQNPGDTQAQRMLKGLQEKNK
jgi:hypothetical protein